MSKCISNRGEYSEHTFTHNPECDYCGELPASRFESMRTALEAIQELHVPVETQVLTGDCAVGECEHEDDCPTVDFVYCGACNEIAELANAYYAEDGMQIVSHPCATRRLADQGLGGGQGG